MLVTVFCLIMNPPYSWRNFVTRKITETLQIALGLQDKFSFAVILMQKQDWEDLTRLFDNGTTCVGPWTWWT
jgi:hypothetical protein